jgi:hypothetical protein
MIPPVIGVLILLAALGLIGSGMVVGLVGRHLRRAALSRAGIVVAGLGGVGYAGAWLIGLAASPARLLLSGQEVSFCGVDCHLHVSVVRVDRVTDLGVHVRFRSDAKRALEYPGLLRLAVVDRAGRRYLPSSGLVAEPLRPGETIEREFRFGVPVGSSGARLQVWYGGWLDYLIPGRANPLAQRRLGLDLDLGS